MIYIELFIFRQVPKLRLCLNMVYSWQGFPAFDGQTLIFSLWRGASRIQCRCDGAGVARQADVRRCWDEFCAHRMKEGGGAG